MSTLSLILLFLAIAFAAVASCAALECISRAFFSAADARTGFLEGAEEGDD